MPAALFRARPPPFARIDGDAVVVAGVDAPALAEWGLRRLEAGAPATGLLHLSGLAVMDALLAAPESAATFAMASRWSACLVAVTPTRGDLRAIAGPLTPDPRARALEVARLAVGLGRQRGLAHASLRALAEAALCLDLGATLLPPAAPLTVQRRHPNLSVDLVAAHGGLGPAARGAVVAHHERLDGSGYPLGLEGAAISTWARMLGLCDLYVSRITPPAVGPPRPPYVAMADIAARDGAGLDPRLLLELEVLLARRDDRWALMPTALEPGAGEPAPPEERRRTDPSSGGSA